MLLLDERIRADGSTARLTAALEDGGVRLRDDDGTEGVLAVAAIGAVMTRYGRPLEETPEPGDRLELGHGLALRRMRYHAIVDTEARDYLLWEQPGQEPLAAIGTTVAAALRFLLARAHIDPSKI